MFSVVVELIIRPKPWYAPQVVVTMVGMLLGNVVSAIAVAITRLFDDIRTRRHAYRHACLPHGVHREPSAAHRPIAVVSYRS
ncbi:ABC transporter permease [Bifidobacterium tissieri]|nr:ABC transporter permease [Bifidobacterium tissieri]